MKKYIFLMMVLLITANLWAQETYDLPDLQKPHQIAVDGNDLYIFDEADYSLHVYTISPFAMKLKVGQKGDGPHDFKYLPFVYVQPEELAFTDFTKTMWFSKRGEVLKVKEYSEFKDFDLNSEMLLFPVRENFLRITANHDLKKRHVTLLDSGFETIKELYEGPFTWRSDAPIHYRTDTLCSDGLIFITDTQRGFNFEVFDAMGNHIRTIDKSPDVEKVADHPLLHQYCVSNNKIFAATYKKEDDKTEMIVLDLEGTILQRRYLPLTSIQPKRGVLRFDLFAVDGGKLYEVVKKSGTEKWELLVTDSEHVPMGPYLGQKPPGLKREIFAPGLVSTGYNEHGVSFTPGGTEIFYRLLGPPHGVVLTMKEENGSWTSPQVASFSGKYDGKCSLSPDGKTLLISSSSPPSGQGPALDYWTIWIIERTPSGWGKAQNLPYLKGAYPTMSNRRAIYFYARGENNKGDIYCSKYENGQYSKAQKVGAPISTEHWENDPYIAPDESYLIFQSDRPGELGNGDLFISFRLKNGEWSEPKNLGDGVNTKESGEACPWVTPDGKYMFFSGMIRTLPNYSDVPITLERKLEVLNQPGHGSEDVFWVRADFIEKLKHEVQPKEKSRR